MARGTTSGRTGPAGPAALKRRGVRVVHVAIPDLDASLRERRLALPDVVTAFGPGGTFVNVLHKWDTGESVYGAPPFVGEPMTVDCGLGPDVAVRARCRPCVRRLCRAVGRAQPARAAEAPDRPGRDAWASRSRRRWSSSSILLDESAELAACQKGFEGFDVFASDNRCWSTQTAAVYGDVVAELEQVMATADVDLFGLGLELGPGCFEATLRACESLRAADNAVLFKTFTKAFARRRGLTASFMAQLGRGLAGPLRPCPPVAGRPARPATVFHDPKAKDGMSRTMRQSIAGLVALAPEALALCAHTVNAYRRLTPGNWAPRTATWAIQNYAAAVRAVPSPAGLARLEFRLPAADTNPYLAIALTLGAALQGIADKAELPAPIGRRRSGRDAGRPARTTSRPAGGGRPARRQPGGARHLRRRFIDHFVASRRHEEAVVRTHVSAFERARYIEAV